jgi:hypothetical protein
MLALFINTYFKNNLNYEILNYSEEKHLFNDLQANGVAYLKNAFDNQVLDKLLY